MICDRCGQAVLIGDWPFCPHGRGTYTAVADDIPGGLTIENLGPEPVTVYSHSERRRLMQQRGLREYVTSGGHAVCETTLANARLLVSPRRGGVPPIDCGGEPVDRDTSAEVETLVLTVTERPEGFLVPPDGEPHT